MSDANYVKETRYNADQKEMREHWYKDMKWKQEARHTQQNISAAIESLAKLHEKNMEESARNTANIRDIVFALNGTNTNISKTNDNLAELTAATKSAVIVTKNIRGAINTIGYLKWLLPILIIAAAATSDLWHQVMVYLGIHSEL